MLYRKYALFASSRMRLADSTRSAYEPVGVFNAISIRCSSARHSDILRSQFELSRLQAVFESHRK